MKTLRSFLLFAAFAFLAASATASDLSITASSFVPGSRAKTVTGIAGVAITAGQLVYLDSSEQTYKLADANASAATAAVAGIAASSVSAGQFIVVITEDDDLTLGATLDMSYPFYICSATAGSIANANDTGAGGLYPVAVLVAKSTTKCVFKLGLKGTAVTAAD